MLAGGEATNEKNVFNADLTLLRVVFVRIDIGKSFHARGLENANARIPNLVFVRGRRS